MNVPLGDHVGGIDSPDFRGWERAARGLGSRHHTLTLRLSSVAAAAPAEGATGCDGDPSAFVFNVLLWEMGPRWPRRAAESCSLPVTSVYVSGERVT